MVEDDQITELVIAAGEGGKLTTNVQVVHMTPEAAKAIVGVASATHTEPVRAFMRYQLAQSGLFVLALIAMPMIGHYLGLDKWIIIVGMGAVGALAWPSRKVLAKLAEQLILKK